MSRKDNVNNVIYYLSNKKPNFQIFKSSISFEKILKEVLIQEPRLLFYISSYSYSYTKNSRLSMIADYTVTIDYNQNAPDSFDDITIDDGTYTLLNYKSLSNPEKLYFISDGHSDLSQRIIDSFHNFHIRYEGLYKVENNSITFDQLSDNIALTTKFTYCLPLNQLNQKKRQAEFKANQIAKDLTGGLVIPPFVKVFLAFSYLQQNTSYDHRAYNNLAMDLESITIDPAPHLSYGPLVEGRGICSGIAYAFKTLMESLNIECMVIHGILNEDSSMDHAWNLVRINNQYYHVDATCGIEQGVCVSSFMKCDSQMNGYHWDQEFFPRATGRHFNYDFIEDWLIDNGEDLVDSGIDSQFVFPDVIE